MKKIVLIVCISILFMSVPFSALASGNDVSLDVSYSVNESGNIKVHASVVDIKLSRGLSVLDYDIEYDSKSLQLINSIVTTPPSWQEMINEEYAEIIAESVDDNTFLWAVFAILEGYGITEDNAFQLELEFKPLSNDNSEIKFTPGLISNDTLAEYKGESVTLTVDPSNKNGDPVEDSEPDVSEELNSIADPSNSNRPTVSDILNVSNDESGEESKEVTSDDASDIQQSENIDQSTESINDESSVEEVNSITSDNSDAVILSTNDNTVGSPSLGVVSSDNSENNNSKTTIIIIASLALIAMIGVIVILIVRAKSKDNVNNDVVVDATTDNVNSDIVDNSTDTAEGDKQ